MRQFRCLWGLFLGSWIALAETLPVKDFFRPVQFSEMQISPDGKSLAVILPESLPNGHVFRSLALMDLIERKPKRVAWNKESDVYAFQWVGNDYLLLKSLFKGIPSGGLYAIDREGKKLTTLVPSYYDVLTEGNLGGMVETAGEIHENAVENEILLEISRIRFDRLRKTDSRPDVYRVDLRTGRRSLVLKNPGSVFHWVCDSNGNVRAGIARDGDRTQLFYRATNQEAWQILENKGILEEDNEPVGFTEDGKNLFVLFSGAGSASSLFTYDPIDRKRTECLFSVPGFDVDSCHFAKPKYRLEAITYTTDRFQTFWVDPILRQAQLSIDSTFTNHVNEITSVDSAREKAVLFSYSDRDPGRYYLLNLKTKRLEKLAELAPWLKPEQLAPMDPIQYQARDGKLVQGYLTKPVTGSPPYPLIVMPHGGPWLRDTWRFNAEVQFLANRGYAILQPNFRGSTGYGYDFEKAGIKEWGRKMQDDITDGVRWAVASQIANEKRMAIFGASYGGYAALMGMEDTPELYQAGICYAGVTDLVLFMESIPDRKKTMKLVMNELVGDPEKEREALEAVSPVNHVERIRRPLLLAYGGSDPIVNPRQGDRLVSALRKANKEFEYIFKQEEGHGFFKEENRVMLFERIEEFLRKNLGQER